MKILISAAEASSDAHGAELLHALREEVAEEARLRAGRPAPGARLDAEGVEVDAGGVEIIDAFGIGGPKLQASGLRTLIDARELLSMGFVEILGRLPRILDALKQLAAMSAAEKPDIAVVIDYPDFHFRLARRLKRQGTRVIYYIPPKVWAWRKRRLSTLRDSFARVLCILPFEAAFYAREKVPATYVGNPLVDELPLKLTRAEARRALGLPEAALTVVAMPGSRPSELKCHTDLFLESLTRAAARLRASGRLGASERLVVLMPFAATADVAPIRERVTKWLDDRAGKRAGHPNPILDLRVSQGDAPICMVAADAGLIKSGTSTLEAGVLGCPHAIVYRASAFSEAVYKHLIRYQGPVGLVNLVADERGPDARAPFLIRELIADRATEDAIATEVIELLTDAARRARIVTGLAHLRAVVLRGADGGSPSRRAAREVLACARERRP